MATAEELKQHLATLEEALSLGAKRVRFQSHETEYHSVEELQLAINAIKRQLAEASPSPRFFNIQGRKGYQ